MIDQPPDPRPPLTPLRSIFAILGMLIVLFAGLSTLFIGWVGWTYGAWRLVLLYCGAPMVAGALILWLALRWRRGDDGGAQNGTGGSND